MLFIDDADAERIEKSDILNVPAFGHAPNKISVLVKAKTTVCNTDSMIGQTVLCRIQDKMDGISQCDSDSLKNFDSYEAFSKEYKLDKNMTDWKILFARRDPIERVVDEFIDTCIKQKRSCYECGIDFNCYVGRIYNVLRELARHKDLITEDHMKILPQNWYCQMEAMANRVTFVDTELYNHSTAKQTPKTKTKERILTEDFFEEQTSSFEKIETYLINFAYSRKDVLYLIKKVYYWDYLLLKMPLPEYKKAEVKDHKDGWR